MKIQKPGISKIPGFYMFRDLRSDNGNERVPDILDPPNPPLIWGACVSPNVYK